MPPLGNAGREAIDAVAREINALSAMCEEIDAGLKAHDWARMDTAIADSRRITHALEEAMAEAGPYRDDRFDAAVFQRLQEIYSFRDDRLRTLTQFHEELGERLRQLSRWKGYARSIGSSEAPRGLSALDSLR